MPETTLDKLRSTDGGFKLGLVAVDRFEQYVSIFRRFKDRGEGSKSDIVALEQGAGFYITRLTKLLRKQRKGAENIALPSWSSWSKISPAAASTLRALGRVLGITVSPATPEDMKENLAAAQELYYMANDSTCQ
jgi:hypothetical protein